MVMQTQEYGNPAAKITQILLKGRDLSTLGGPRLAASIRLTETLEGVLRGEQLRRFPLPARDGASNTPRTVADPHGDYVKMCAKVAPLIRATFGPHAELKSLDENQFSALIPAATQVAGQLRGEMGRRVLRSANRASIGAAQQLTVPMSRNEFGGLI